MKLQAIDLFCGAGGLSAGLVEAGFDVVCAIDNWDVAVETYSANFPSHKAHKEDIGALGANDLERLGIPKGVHLLAGGPPCQGFSIQRIGADEDDRNDLISSFAKMVDLVRPKVFVMENVRGLLGKRGKAYLERFIASVADSGYETDYEVLDASDFRVPQYRKRVFVVGWQKGSCSSFQFPSPTAAAPVTVGEAIGDLRSPPTDHTPAEGDALHRRSRLSALNLERLKHIPQGGGFEDLPVELRVNCHKKGSAKIGHRSVYGRLSSGKPAATITARFDSFTRGRFAHPTEDRNITLREGARLQGFSDGHTFCGTQEEIAALIGNAVPPPLAASIANSVSAFLERNASYPHAAVEPQLEQA